VKISRRELMAGGAALVALPVVGTMAVADVVPKTEMPKEGVIILAQLKAKPGEEETVGKALLAMVEPTRKEDGCICYNLHQDASDKTKFMFYEQWAGKEALDAHGKSPHMKTMQGKINGLIEKSEVAFFELMG